jgi:phytoene synthase
VKSDTERFSAFLGAQIERYMEWQRGAEEGFSYIPRRFLIPIKTASEMYKWTAGQLEKEPLLVYQQKVKPSVARLVGRVAYNALVLPWQAVNVAPGTI